MSGFVVIVNPADRPVDRELLQALTHRLARRGPDGLGIWSEGRVGMGHALLRTTPQAKEGTEPATLESRTWIVSNARIDDRSILLGRLGHPPSVDLERTPDSDLILRAFDKWGEDCASRLLGDFAFAIWDAYRQRLYCARDPFGLCQLYYAQVDESLVVSNSLYCLLGYPGISRGLDDEAVAGFLLFGDHTWANKGITAFADVKAVPPAHRLVLCEGSLRLEPYWDFPLEVPLSHYRHEHEYLEHFRCVFEQAVADRMRAPSVVIAMSGGMDSSSIGAMAVRVRSKGGGSAKLHALSVRYDRIMASDEPGYASLAATHLGIDLRFVDGGRYPLLEPPVATTRPLELYSAGGWMEMFRTAIGLGPVMLYGEGGDALFAYSAGPRTLAGVGPLRVAADLFRVRRYSGSWPGLGTGLRRLGRRVAGGDCRIPSHAPFPYPTWLDHGFERRMGLRERWRDFWTGGPAPSNRRHPRMQKELTGPDWHFEEQFLNPGFTLPEVRDPFLDLRLIGWMLSLPPMPWSFRKYLLRRAMAKELPEHILRRRKVPLGEIHQALLLRPEASWIDEWRLPTELSGYIDAARVPSLRASETGADERYLALRPLLLDRWLIAVERTLAHGL
jgi:asparagine synthase (glutamine-hydrolysing)